MKKGNTAVSPDVGKNGEEELRRSEQHYRSIIEHAPYGIYQATAAGRFTMVNPALIRMLGYDSEKEVLALDLATKVYKDPKDREQILKVSEKFSRPLSLEATWKTKSDQTITVCLLGRVLESDTGPDGYEVFVENITERKDLENQLHHTQKMEALGELAGGMSHDFNNLLGIILAQAWLIAEKFSDDDPLRVRAQSIIEASERGASLTRQLLAFSRKQFVDPKVLSLNDLVSDTVRLLDRTLGEEIELKTVLGKDLWPIVADSGQIQQILLNLAINARDAMSEGGKLSIETSNVGIDNAFIYLSTHMHLAAADYVLLVVSDTGAGMPEETKSRIFEPFFTTKGVGKGTGLGLAIVYGIVAQSGGHIWVDSQVGKGTTFKIYLPRAPRTVSPTNLKPEATSARGSETVLVAEDEKGFRNVIADVLGELGYKVLHVANGTEALELLSKHDAPIHLIISDVIMPELSGAELARKVHNQFPTIKLLFVSGYTGDAMLRQGGLGNSVGFLQKPFTPQALARKVRDVLDETESEISSVDTS